MKMDLNAILVNLNASWSVVVVPLLNLILALVLLLAGYVAARLIAGTVSGLLKLVQLDKSAKRFGLTAFFEKGDIRRSFPELIGDVFYWLVILISIITVARWFGLPLDPALAKVFSFVGLIFVASITLGIGLFFASLISGMVKVFALNLGLEGARTFSRVIYYLIVIFAFLAALAELGISPEVFVPQIGVIIGAVGLAAAIAFGLGCKDMAADFLHNLFKGK